MVVVTTATLVVGKVLVIVLNTLRVAAMCIILIVLGVAKVIGLEISAMLVLNLVVVEVTVHFTPLAERPARQWIGLSGLRAGLVAISMCSFPSGEDEGVRLLRVLVSS